MKFSVYIVNYNCLLKGFCITLNNWHDLAIQFGAATPVIIQTNLSKQTRINTDVLSKSVLFVDRDFPPFILMLYDLNKLSIELDLTNYTLLSCNEHKKCHIYFNCHLIIGFSLSLCYNCAYHQHKYCLYSTQFIYNIAIIHPSEHVHSFQDTAVILSYM